MKIKTNYKLKKVRIPKLFTLTPPSPRKVKTKEDYINLHPDNVYLTVNWKHKLLDGYASYIAAKNLGVERITVRELNSKEEKDFRSVKDTLYVYGKHQNSDKIYMWRVTEIKMDELSDIKRGDRLVVQTKKGPAIITVTKTEKKKYSPINKKVRTVLGRPDKE